MALLLSLFVNPGFLFGLFAAGLPVVIHLLSRRKAEEIFLPTMRFLRETAERTASRRRFEELLLLLLRAGAICALALALARPVLRAGGGDGRDAAALLLLDDTCSTAQEVGGRSVFEQLREAAGEAVRPGRDGAGLPPGARWALWRAGGGAAPGLRRIEARPPEASRKLSELRPGQGGADLAGAVAEAVAALRAEPTGQRELVILTDGQASGWRGTATAALPPGPPIRIFVLVPPGTGGPNAWIDSLQIRCRAPLPGVQAQAEAVVRATAAVRTSVSLHLDGLQAGRESVSVPAGGSASVLFPVPLAKAGWRRLEARLEADGCLADNRRFAALEVREAVRLLLVDGSTATLPRERAGFYLEAALAPLGAAGRVRRITPDLWAREDLTAFDAVWLCETRPPEPAMVERLRGFVRSGGSLVLFPGADAAGWTQAFGAAEGGLLPLGLDRIEAFEPALGLEPGEGGHPLLAGFAAVAEEQFGRARLRRAWRFTLDPRASCRVALRREDGHPVLLTREEAGGLVALWAAPPAPSWGTLQARPVFVPLLHALAVRGLETKGGEAGLCGAPLLLGRFKERVKVRTPGGEAEAEAGPDGIALLRSTAEAGFYEVGEAGKEVRVAAVNPPTGEGDLSAGGREALGAWLGRAGEVAWVEDGESLRRAVAAARTRRSLLDILLVAALALLAAEAYAGSRRRG